MSIYFTDQIPYLMTNNGTKSSVRFCCIKTSKKMTRFTQDRILPVSQGKAYVYNENGIFDLNKVMLCTHNKPVHLSDDRICSDGAFLMDKDYTLVITTAQEYLENPNIETASVNMLPNRVYCYEVSETDYPQRLRVKIWHYIEEVDLTKKSEDCEFLKKEFHITTARGTLEAPIMNIGVKLEGLQSTAHLIDEISALSGAQLILKDQPDTLPKIWSVVYRNPATIVFWKDGTKTVVKCGKNDKYDPEKGLVLCMVKKLLGNKGNYYNKLRDWLPMPVSKKEMLNVFKEINEDDIQEIRVSCDDGKRNVELSMKEKEKASTKNIANNEEKAAKKKGEQNDNSTKVASRKKVKEE